MVDFPGIHLYEKTSRITSRKQIITFLDIGTMKGRSHFYHSERKFKCTGNMHGMGFQTFSMKYTTKISIGNNNSSAVPCYFNCIPDMIIMPMSNKDIINLLKVFRAHRSRWISAEERVY